MSTTGTTDTTQAAREHARAQAGTIAEAMPHLPARSAPFIGEDLDPTLVTWAETVRGGGYTSRTLSRGTTIRLTDRDGDACAQLLIYNALDPWERLNVADTVKVPWQAYLGAGHPLLSDQGRVLATVVSDTSAHHDALCGTSLRTANEERYGDGAPQGPAPAGRELFKLAAAKHGLEPRDLPANVSFFQGVRVEPDGALTYVGSAGPGRSVELRAELPLIVLVANVPHPLDPRPEYTCTGLEITAWRGRPTQPEDALWTHSPELERALLNTTGYAEARGA